MNRIGLSRQRREIAASAQAALILVGKDLGNYEFTAAAAVRHADALMAELRKPRKEEGPK